MKTIECKDRERILREQDPTMLEALDRHAAGCAECAGELGFWRDISTAAKQMHKTWESPYLWPRIERALSSAPRRWWDLFPWRAAAALAMLLLLLLPGAWIALHRRVSPPGPDSQRRLLTEQAMREVANSEAAYAASIDKLAILAEPKIKSPRTALLASYREKLLVLDAAIAECRGQIEQNRGNPQLRQELMAMYREKELTLQEVISEE